MEPKFIQYARSTIGEREIGVTNKSPFILKMAINLNVEWMYGQPWCGLWLAHCMEKYNYPIPKHFYRARAWLNHGTRVPEVDAFIGCIAVFGRKGGGHVGFPLKRNYAGDWLVLGANQKNKVGLDWIKGDRLLGLVRPQGFWLPEMPIQTESMAGDFSVNEA